MIPKSPPLPDPRPKLKATRPPRQHRVQRQIDADTSVERLLREVLEAIQRLNRDVGGLQTGQVVALLEREMLRRKVVRLEARLAAHETRK